MKRVTVSHRRNIPETIYANFCKFMMIVLLNPIKDTFLPQCDKTRNKSNGHSMNHTTKTRLRRVDISMRIDPITT